MTIADIRTIPARSGIAVNLTRGQCARIINTHGQQVVDAWAFRSADTTEFMSMEHSRASVRKTTPGIGESYQTNRRRPILTVAADTSPGVHDTLIASCDPQRYRDLGHSGYHDNCTENLHAALAALGTTAPITPCPLNLFMNIAILANGTLEWRHPTSKPGDSITLQADMDCIAVFSACPMDLLPINGVDGEPTEAHVEVVPSRR